MRPGIFYLPEYHSFEHIGIAPWPHIYTDYQQDWILAVDTLEQWLNRYCGAHYSDWAYGQQQNQEYWQACIAFKLAKHKTLFLLTWSS
jgi:hypothetical protein